ncbi:MAG: thioredoxin domain-containing protein, partial [Proteobacteria bacterium]|nr:thioredoxin domain-containing protein [Pseudomonadota bacterium]
QPTALSEMLSAYEFYLGDPLEIVIVTPENEKKNAEPFLAELRKRFVPNAVLVVTAEGKEREAVSRTVPLVENKAARNGKTTAYVCRQGVCGLPTTDPSEFAARISCP